MEKRHLDRRLWQMQAEGTVFRCGVTAGRDVSAAQLRADYEAVVLCGGATVARGLPVPGADLAGVHQAMEYLPQANRAVAASLVSGGGPASPGPVPEPPISARGKHVVIIGGGDTGADCLGTAHRQGARSVTQLEILPRPTDGRPAHQPWPMYPMIYRVSSAHEEGGERVYAVSTKEFLGDGTGRLRALRLIEVELADGKFAEVPSTERDLPCELVLLAMGFTGAQREGLLAGLGVDFDPRGNVARDASFATSVPGVFVAGDMGRGQSLIVWAIAEGRAAAAAVDAWLTGDTVLPTPITPNTRSMA
jgi:glutamate synthase (NADPH/NADH) small chain